MELLKLYQEWAISLQSGRSLSKHTLAAYQQDWQQFMGFFQGYYGHTMELSSLIHMTLTDLRAWLADRHQKGLHARSTARSLSGIKSFFRFLQKNNYLEHHPLFSIRPPRLKKTLPRPLSMDQALALINDISQISNQTWIGQRDRALFMLIYSTGLRLGEALNLTYKDLSSQDYLTIRGKGEKFRKVPFLPKIRLELEAYCQLCPFSFSSESPLFLGAQGKKLSPTIAERQMQRYRIFVGLPDWATPHALRHSCATHLMHSSSDLRAIQELLGHASPSTTQIYTDIDKDYLLRAYQAAHPRSQNS